MPFVTGCTDFWGTNYNSAAVISDCSCIFAPFTVPGGLCTTTGPKFVTASVPLFPTFQNWQITHNVNNCGGRNLEHFSSNPDGWSVGMERFTSMVICAPCPPVGPGPPYTQGQVLETGLQALFFTGFSPFQSKYFYAVSNYFNWIFDTSSPCSPGTGTPAPGLGAVANPFNLQHKSGQYHATGINAPTEGTALFWRSDYAVPSTTWAVLQVSLPFGGSCSDPRVERDFRGLLYAVGTEHKTATTSWNVLLSRSDDDGATWNTASTVLVSCKHGTIINGHGGGLTVAGWSHTSSALMAIYQGTGDTAFSAPYSLKDQAGIPITAVDDTFQIAAEWEEPGRYILHYPSSTTGTTIRRSGDDGATWETAVTTMAGKHPTVSHFGGISFAAVYSGGNLSIKRQEPGDTAFSTAYTAKGPATGTVTANITANLALQDDTFHMMSGYEGPGRMVLHALETGQSRTTHLYSNDAGTSWTRLT